MSEKAMILDEKAMQRAIARISYEIIERNKGTHDLCIVGILSRGAELAKRIAAKIQEVEGVQIPTGFIDITEWRDDIQANPDYQDKTELDFQISNKKIVLVDDVMYTGRTVRAAIDSLMEKGRPQNIQLAVLIDRGHRELPIRADFIGKNLPTSRDEQVRVYVSERDGMDKVAIL
ncbi:MAG: uracil phosphoribosyltransferase [Oscillospiraceae bacterium]|jgi:pyrimidine operon attenuation protein/uracil phosphoribosyltransferase|nr:uracil phosphoribosyltransferase [Oscillospiraceae bacterium]